MTRAWPLRLPASVDITDRDSRRVWTLALSLGLRSLILQVPFQSHYAHSPTYRRKGYHHIAPHDDYPPFVHLVFRLVFALVATASTASASSNSAHFTPNLHYSWRFLGRTDQTGYYQGRTAHVACIGECTRSRGSLRVVRDAVPQEVSHS
ncbi:hypothetical protein H4582DRAFT_762678 [Lactarius indigo]|nr:hypothetical protein H4582DRAFT_762678 [Lactarius indigo]